MASADPELPCYGLGRGYNGHGLPPSSSSDPVADALEMYHMIKQSAMPANYYSPPFPLLPNPSPSFNIIPPPLPENYSRPNEAAMAMMKNKKTKTKKKKQQQQQQNSLNEPNSSLLLAVEERPLNMVTNSETVTRPPAPSPPLPACKRKAAVSLVRTQRPHSFKSGGESEDSSSVAYKQQQFRPPKLPQQNHHDNEEEEEEEQDYNDEEEEEEEEEGGEEEVVEEREGEGEEEEEKKAKWNSPTIARSGKNSSKQSLNNNSAVPPKASQGYVHLRARRGQATDSHSLAERVRREKISERMKLLQDLVPGCSKTLGKAMMLDEIINYVQSLQHQVEFLSMKLAALSPQMDFQFDNLVIGEKWRSGGATKTTENKNAEEVGNMLFNPGSNMSFQMLLNTPLTLPSHSTDFPHFKGGGGYNEDALLNAVHAAIN